MSGTRCDTKSLLGPNINPKEVVAEFSNRIAVRREGSDWYFPTPVFLGDGKEWNLHVHGSITGRGCWLWLRDLRNPLTYGGGKDWQVELNPQFPVRFPLYVGDEVLMRHVHHVCIKTIKGERFAMLLTERPLTFHGNLAEDTPLEESVSVNSERDAEHIVAENESLLFVRSDSKIISAQEYALGGGLNHPTQEVTTWRVG